MTKNQPVIVDFISGRKYGNSSCNVIVSPEDYFFLFVELQSENTSLKVENLDLTG